MKYIVFDGVVSLEVHPSLEPLEGFWNKCWQYWDYVQKSRYN